LSRRDRVHTDSTRHEVAPPGQASQGGRPHSRVRSRYERDQAREPFGARACRAYTVTARALGGRPARGACQARSGRHRARSGVGGATGRDGGSNTLRASFGGLGHAGAGTGGSESRLAVVDEAFPRAVDAGRSPADRACREGVEEIPARAGDVDDRDAGIAAIRALAARTCAAAAPNLNAAARCPRTAAAASNIPATAATSGNSPAHTSSTGR
jgi:hypothetical protein